jgi:ABC-type multidrug transport system ATPase subunit
MNEIIIKTENLTKKFKEVTVVNNLNIEIKKGEIFGFLGPNGSGKSTTIKMLCGLIAPTSGNAWIHDLSIINDGEEIRKEIGYMSQRFSLYDDLTAKQNLIFYSKLYKVNEDILESKLNQIMDLTQLTKEQNKQASKLSGGYKQRLSFACALIHDPKIIFLDEPTAGIDPVARKEIWDLFIELANKGLTLFVTTHYMDEAERCTKLGYIFDGKLIAYGLKSDLASSKENLEGLFVRLTKEQTNLLAHNV